MAGNDSYTVSLLHMNGDDASPTFTDDAAGGTHIWTPVATAQIDTAQSKFGGASGLFDADSDYIHAPDSDDFFFGTGDFTIDFWIRWNSLPAASGYNFFASQRVDVNTRWLLYLYNDAGTYRFYLYAKDGTTVQINYLTWVANTLATNTWYHIALVRKGNNFYVFQAGTSLGTQTSTGSIPNIAAQFDMGNHNAAGYINGWVDEYRISKGIARWTANFTPPTVEYFAVSDTNITASPIEIALAIVGDITLGKSMADVYSKLGYINNPYWTENPASIAVHSPCGYFYKKCKGVS